MASPSRLPSVRKPAGSGRARPLSVFEAPTEHLKSLQRIEGGSHGNGDGSLPNNGTTSKQAKRRSLLPSFSTSRKTSGGEKEIRESMIREDTSDSEVSSRPRDSEDSRSMPPPPKPSRTASLRPSGSSAGRAAAAHARTVSKEGNVVSSKPSLQPGGPSIPQRTDSLHKRTGSTRLPTTHRPGASTATPSQQSIPARGSSTRAATSTVALKRSSVVMGKPPALDTSMSSQARGQPSPISPTGSATSRTKSQMLPPSTRPAFSTYQQHYSPAKSGLPKPPLPSTRGAKVVSPASAEPEIPMTLEIALEQMELLQLSLLHQNSALILEEYEQSARSKLGELHAKLQKDFESIRTHEEQQRRCQNLHALESWCPDEALLAEHLQTLSRVVSDLRAHTESGSRYSDLTETFDMWVTRAESVLLDGQNQAIEALPETWRAVHTSVALKLRSIQRDIGVLPPAPQSDIEHASSLEIVLDNCSALVDSMLKELEVMTKLQKEVLQQGKLRMDEQINALISANEQAQGSEKESWIPAWQSVK
ncbi:Hypothetical predicted protein [Lecanosticta acicola]|uniref:Uncharacterized protein n=1 Tax=Lecanosticta acicola TaxID=111012 RepID=A0AAI9ED18_9PEZI|nr:Hypothetical predicted protein [Lecanosticta acicola]